MKKGTFTERVLKIVREIPEGSVLSYGEVAKKAGNPKGGRAVGNIMRNNFDKSVPCHRVIYGNGHVGPYNRGGEAKKRALLEKEGAVI